MRYFLLLCAVSTACVWAQNSPITARYVTQMVAQPKTWWCRVVLGFDYYIVQRPNNTVEIDRNYYLRRWNGYWNPRPCPPHVLFTLTEGCLCDTRVPDPDLLNTERCITISGNAQRDQNFDLDQTNSVRRPVWVSNYGNLPRTSSCKGTNSALYRQVEFFSNNVLAMTQLDVSVGFSIPQEPTPDPGSEYRIFATSPCSQDPSTEASFRISYVASRSFTSPTISAVFQLQTHSTSAESQGFITCTILFGVNHPSNPGRNYNWDFSDPGNMVRVVMNLNDLSVTLGLYNSEMRRNGINDPTQVPSMGFCDNPVRNLPPTGLGQSYTIPSRMCPVGLGIAPGSSFMCIYDVSIQRDC